MADVAVITQAGHVHRVPRQEDEDLCAALTRRGHRARILPWTQDGLDWSTAHLCVVRSAYDWADRTADFLKWASQVPAVWNPPGMLRRGTDKSYLLELKSDGIEIIPSVLLRVGTAVDLDRLLEERGWTAAVIKPAIGIASRGVHRILPEDRAPGQARLDRMLARRDVLVQPYLPSIESEGELSLIFLDGRISHAVRRVPRSGDFRAHFLHGAAESRVAVSANEEAIGSRILSAVGEGAPFGRIDLIRGADGRLLLSEVELVAPVLYFRHEPAACDRLADAIGRRLEASR